MGKKIFPGKQQKGILLAAGIILAVIILFFIFSYGPKRTRMAQLKAEINQMQSSVTEIESIVGGKENLAQGLTNLKKELVLLDGAFLKTTELTNFLKLLSEKAKEFDIDIISIRPSDIKVLTDRENKPVYIDEQICKKADIRLQMVSSYLALGRFTEFIQSSSSPVIAIENITIDKQADLLPKLNVSLTVSTFLLSPGKQQV